MNFSMEWEQHYREATHLSLWPWSDLISYVMRYARPQEPSCRVLEIGCGAGANIPFFQDLGVNYHGIDGSPSIVGKLRERFPALKDQIVAADFTLDIPFDGGFDLVVDRSSLTHNSTAAIVNCLGLIHAKLKPGGKFIGIDWFSTDCDYQHGCEAGDTYTRDGFLRGEFVGFGRVHFSDKPHLQELFKNFKLSRMQHKTIQQEIPDAAWHFSTWNFVAEKSLIKNEDEK